MLLFACLQITFIPSLRAAHFLASSIAKDSLHKEFASPNTVSFLAKHSVKKPSFKHKLLRAILERRLEKLQKKIEKNTLKRKEDKPQKPRIHWSAYASFWTAFAPYLLLPFMTIAGVNILISFWIICSFIASIYLIPYALVVYANNKEYKGLGYPIAAMYLIVIPFVASLSLTLFFMLFR